MSVAHVAVQLANYQFLGVGGVATIGGMFLDSSGNQIGASWSGTVDEAGAGGAVPATLISLSGLAEIPALAISAQVAISGEAVYWSSGALQSALVTDLKTNYINYPQLAVGSNTLGATTPYVGS